MNRREKINEILTSLECRRISRFEAVEQIDKLLKKKEIGPLNDTLKTQIEEISSVYAIKIHPIRKLTDNAYHNISLRLRSFSVEECRAAIDNFSRDEWNMSNNGHRGLEWFFAKDERIETYMRLIPKTAKGEETFTGFKVGNKVYKDEDELKEAEERGEVYYDNRKNQFVPSGKAA